MTVADLIEKLKSFDPKTLVVTAGFDEHGFSDIEVIKPVKIKEVTSEAVRAAIGEYEEGNADSATAILIDHY